MRSLERKLSSLLRKNKMEDERRLRVNNFIVRVEEVANKMRKSFGEIRRELYRIVLEKILKDNEKI
jgi:hypothetical protein